MFGKIRMCMNSGSVLGYFLQALPICCLAGLVCLAVRLPLLKKRNAKIQWPAEFLRLLFVCYLAGLITLVILPANFFLHVYDGLFLGWWDELEPVFQLGDIHLVPSVIGWLNGTLSLGSWVKTMLLGNVAMFFPMGLLLPLAANVKSGRKMLRLSVAIPLLCESLQLVFGRSFDTDDLLCNFLGMMIGAALSFGILKIKSPASPCGGTA